MRRVNLSTERINLVFSTDWHLSAMSPGRRADDYQSAILGKLEFIRQIAEKLQGVALCGGDVFHIKSNRHPANSLSLLVALLRSLRTFPTGLVYGSVGNHDLALGERMDSLPSQPLGLMIAAGVYHDLTSEPVLFYNTPAVFPATLDGPAARYLGVQVESFPYDHGEETLGRILASRRHPNAKYHVGIVHAYGQPGGAGSYFGEKVIGYDEVAGADFDFLLWGHDHSRVETQKVGNVAHIRHGSLARAALDIDQTDRPVCIAVLSFSDEGETKVKEIPVPVKPLEQAFVVADQAVRKVEKSEEMKEFFSKMDEAVDGVETSDPAEALRLLCPDDPTLLALAKELCGL